MNVFNMKELALNNKGEYVLGSADLKTHACYMIYGVLNAGEKDRLIKPGKGHEEIVCLISGEVFLRGDSESFVLKEGQAFHLRGEEAFYMDNKGGHRAVYLISGGHSEGHSH